MNLPSVRLSNENSLSNFFQNQNKKKKKRKTFLPNLYGFPNGVGSFQKILYNLMQLVYIKL